MMAACRVRVPDAGAALFALLRSIRGTSLVVGQWPTWQTKAEENRSFTTG
jgi:hypothetical protein